MSRTNNTLASFLGDPQFPNVGIESSRGGKILLHQNLCMQYSRLEFTRQRDRPIAISGLEKRLVHSFGICGGFGVLDDGENPGLFRRSMLWHRASDCTTLKRIQFDSSAPPTWSWMSYEGHIEYLDLPFARVHWEQLAIVSPWLGDKTPIWYSLGDHSGLMEVPVVVRSLSIIDPQATENGPIILDIVDDTALLISAMCVVLGITRDSTQEGPEGRTHAILVLTASVEKTASSLPVYNRIGVGFVPGHWIGSDDEGKYGVLV
ncbi:hypothetical protein N0V93_008172 [Gnomoniopsis smithogilvyi]|uniref:Uncharacterized protein n=1 Tax=Gnomoniopsis smithogilvyi TaxID=1191159 RepID=A0A9W8YLH2_9PEZI|nr:hypothetical protein N0V93_008172 [Gnomoniopsis smithogilvyi]